MISRIFIEFEKLFQNKKIIFSLIMICGLNICIFAYNQQSDPTFSNSAYIKLQQKLNQIPNSQRYRYIKEEYEKYHAFNIIETINQLRESDNQKMINTLINENPDIEQYQTQYQQNHEPYYTDSIESEEIFLEFIYQEFEILHQYSSYLENIQEKADTISNISIFQNNDDFSTKNIQKTLKDYQNLFNVEIIYESEKGINDALSFPITNFLILIAMFILASSMIIDEKDKKLFSIIKMTPNGQWSLMLTKCIVMIVTIGLLSFIMIFSQLVFMYLTTGLGDLTKTIQSLASYNYCSFKINVLQFLILFFLVKWIAASFIGLIMMWFITVMNNKITSIISILMIIGIETILYFVIPPLHSLYLLKYLNIISLLQIDSIFQIYRNVNCFGYPLSLQWLMIVVLLAGFIFSMVICILSYHYKKNMLITDFVLPFGFKHHSVSLSLFWQEMYKSMIIQKLLVLCIICVSLQIYQYHDIKIYKSQDTIIYMEYMKKLEGKLTSEKEQWILQQQQYYEALNEQKELLSEKKTEMTEEQMNSLVEKIDQQLIGENAFEEILAQYQRIKDDPKCEFVTPFAYQCVFLDRTWTILPTIILCLFLILGLSNIFPFEYQNQTHKLTLVTIKGNHKLIHYKIFISIIICVLFMLFITVPILYLFQNTYGFSSLSASIASIESILLPSWISIAMACFLSLLLKLFAIICMVLMMHAVAIKTRNYILTCFISILIFVVPLLLSYIGFRLLDPISLYPMLMNGTYIKEYSQIVILIANFTCYLILMIFSIRYIYKHYKCI